MLDESAAEIKRVVAIVSDDWTAARQAAMNLRGVELAASECALAAPLSSRPETIATNADFISAPIRQASKLFPEQPEARQQIGGAQCELFPAQPTRARAASNPCSRPRFARRAGRQSTAANPQSSAADGYRSNMGSRSTRWSEAP